MIRKLADGRFRLYSRKKNSRTGKRRNLGTFANRRAFKRHENLGYFFVVPGRRVSAGPGIQHHVSQLRLDFGFARSARAPE